MSQFSEYLSDEDATLSFGRRLARAIAADGVDTAASAAAGGVIYLRGDLGAGKTTLTRGLLRGYGYEGAVKSPTYTLVEPYELAQCHIYHFDLYRLADPGEMEYLGTEDYFQSSNLCIVEWPERGVGFLEEPDLLIGLGAEGSGRRLSCEPKSERGRRITKRLRP